MEEKSSGGICQGTPRFIGQHIPGTQFPTLGSFLLSGACMGRTQHHTGAREANHRSHAVLFQSHVPARLVKKLYLLAAVAVASIFGAVGTLLYAGYLDVKNFYLNLALFPGTMAAAFVPGIHSDFFI